MTTKLKIDLAQGVLEIEGSESFVKAIYTDFKAHFIGEGQPLPSESSEEPPAPLPPRRGKTVRLKHAAKNPPAVVTPAPPPSTPPTESSPAVETVDTKTPKRKTITVSPYNLVKDLNLRAEKGRPSLTEFTDLKFPITNEERNLVFVYYLQEILKLESITLDHVYTCYREVNIRNPVNIQNSLEVTANQHQWVQMKDGDIEITPAGRDFVEKRLPIKR